MIISIHKVHDHQRVGGINTQYHLEHLVVSDIRFEDEFLQFVVTKSLIQALF